MLTLCTLVTFDVNAATLDVLHFYADWCAPCRADKPGIAVLEKEGHHFTHMDIDKRATRLVARMYDVRSIPTYVVIDMVSGGEVYRAHHLGELSSFLKKHDVRPVVPDVKPVVPGPVMPDIKPVVPAPRRRLLGRVTDWLGRVTKTVNDKVYPQFPQVTWFNLPQRIFETILAGLAVAFVVGIARVVLTFLGQRRT